MYVFGACFVFEEDDQGIGVEDYFQVSSPSLVSHSSLSSLMISLAGFSISLRIPLSSDSLFRGFIMTIPSLTTRTILAPFSRDSCLLISDGKTICPLVLMVTISSFTVSNLTFWFCLTYFNILLKTSVVIYGLRWFVYYQCIKWLVDVGWDVFFSLGGDVPFEIS